MNTTKTSNNNLIIFGIPLLLLASLILLSNSQILELHVLKLSIAATIDFVFTIPIIYYFLIRKSNINKKTVVPFFILGIVLASFVIPKEHQGLLSGIKTWIVPIVEITVFSLVIINIYKGIRIYKEKKEQSFDLMTNIRSTCESLFPKKMASFLTLEILSFYYGFIHWKKIKLKENEFTYHKNTGSRTLFAAVIFLIAIETVALHLLLVRWSTIAAWILTGISIYSAFQIFGFLRSISKRPIIINSESLELRYGILSEVAINIQEIELVEITTKSFDEDDSMTVYLSPLGNSEGHNILLTLKTERTLIGVYGIRKNFKKIALYIDEKDAFKTSLDNKIMASKLF